MSNSEHQPQHDWRLLECPTEEGDPVERWVAADDDAKPFLVWGDWIVRLSTEDLRMPVAKSVAEGYVSFGVILVGYLSTQQRSRFWSATKDLTGDITSCITLPAYPASGGSDEQAQRLHDLACAELTCRGIRGLLAEVEAILGRLEKMPA